MAFSSHMLRIATRASRSLFLRVSTPSCSTPLIPQRSFAASSDDGSFTSTLPPSTIRSPFADPTRTKRIPKPDIESSRLLSSNKAPPEEQKYEERPVATVTPPVAEEKKVQVEEKVQPISDVDRAIAQQYEMARAVPIRTGTWKRIVDRMGLAIDQNASDEEKKRQRTTRNTKIGGFFVGGSSLIGFVTFCFYYARGERDAEGRIVKDEFSGQILAPVYRIIKNFRAWRDYVVEPSRDRLLPDPLPPGYIQPKYTIVIEMKNVLVSPEWTYKTGYRFKLRPALEYFLDVVGYPNFEVVIYTSESSMTADPVITSIDPKQRIMYRLYRDCTKYKNGHHIKDLSRLNRDLTKVIHIDYDPSSFELHPENVLRVPKWEGDMADTALVDLAELLKTIHLSDVEDVRPVLEYYSQFDDPAKEFRKRAIYMAEQEVKAKQAFESQDSSLLKRYSGKLFGFRRHASA